jgi:hypothetical protein
LMRVRSKDFWGVIGISLVRNNPNYIFELMSL